MNVFTLLEPEPRALLGRSGSPALGICFREGRRALHSTAAQCHHVSVMEVPASPLAGVISRCALQSPWQMTTWWQGPWKCVDPREPERVVTRMGRPRRGLCVCGQVPGAGHHSVLLTRPRQALSPLHHGQAQGQVACALPQSCQPAGPGFEPRCRRPLT